LFGQLLAEAVCNVLCDRQHQQFIGEVMKPQDSTANTKNGTDEENNRAALAVTKELGQPLHTDSPIVYCQIDVLL
jgi:hypothetical protein